MHSTGRHSVIWTSCNTLVVCEYARARIGAYYAVFVTRWPPSRMHITQQLGQETIFYTIVPVLYLHCPVVPVMNVWDFLEALQWHKYLNNHNTNLYCFLMVESPSFERFTSSANMIEKQSRGVCERWAYIWKEHWKALKGWPCKLTHK